MERFAPGTVLGGRFECHGVIGHGGTATVVLATDRLRSERVALKIVHPHLAADPSTLRRLQREVQTASVLRAPEALVPNDLHELDGYIALSMPFHPGQTLAERVADGGPLPIDDVRALGVRIARALAAAHRSGILHRDVSANNVLVGADARDAVLTDFGLSRAAEASRTTGVLGTQGYAAPEIYAGARPEPRSDLYGLGATLYLAITGRPPFPEGAAGLKRQLDGDVVPIASLRPECPADLVALVEALLRPEPKDRPPGAGDVADALAERRAAEPALAEAPKASVAKGVLPSGTFTVLIRERSDDADRRRRARRRRRNAAPTAEDEVIRWGSHLVERVRTALGVPAPPTATPEERLAAAVAEAAHVPGLEVTPTMFERRFRLIDATDRATADALASAAQDLGFRASVHEVVERRSGISAPWIASVVYGLLVASMFAAAGTFGSDLLPPAIILTVAGALLLPRVATMERVYARSTAERIPVAYRAAVLGGSTVAAGAAAPTVAATSTASAPPATRGAKVAAPTYAALDALQAAVQGPSDLPDAARRDLTATAEALRAEADLLVLDLDELERALTERGPTDGDVAALRARLGRLETLAAAGERVDPAERERITRAIASIEADRAAGEQLGSRVVAVEARLLEIASTAGRVRRELLLARGPAPTADLLERLRVESAAAEKAQRELGRAAARDREQRARMARERS